MNLEQIADNTRTDPHTTHSYLPLYERLLTVKKKRLKILLELVFNAEEE